MRKYSLEHLGHTKGKKSVKNVLALTINVCLWLHMHRIFQQLFEENFPFFFFNIFPGLYILVDESK
jgi:hypothetical protein